MEVEAWMLTRKGLEEIQCEMKWTVRGGVVQEVRLTAVLRQAEGREKEEAEP